MTSATPHSHNRDRAAHGHGGRLIGWPRGYDLLTAVAFGGRERRARRRLARGSGAKRGDRVLDIGCGTGSLTMALARIAGPEKVAGVDPSEKMVGRAAGKKGAKAIDYRVAYAQKLPFADGSFDLVTSCLAFHHIPETERAAVFAEIRRVLAPSGRIYLIDFSPTPRGIVGRVFAHLTHGRTDQGLNAVATLASEAGFAGVEVVTTTSGVLAAVAGDSPAA